MGGRYVPSLLAAIGEVVEEHMVRIGFLVPEGAAPLDEPNIKAATGQPALLESVPLEGTRGTDRAPARGAAADGQPPMTGSGAGASYARICPHCGNRSLHRIEGCWTCATCQYSHCG
jgi:ribonucleoside-diphosphate reductase alpha chain